VKSPSTKKGNRRRHENIGHLLNDLHQSLERSYSEHAGHRELLGVQDHRLPRLVNSQNVTRVAINMTTVHTFDIEPIGRFAGLNAGIRRPKVHLYKPTITQEFVLMLGRRKSLVFRTMQSISSV
jgi:hypothetical protein